MNEELPKGWVVVKLPDVCAINPPKPPRNALVADAPVTFVPMPAVDAEQGAIITPVPRAFSEVRKGFTAFRDGDVIMAKITPCMENGKAAIARGLLNGFGFGSTEFHVLRSTGAVLPEYVYYFIRQESFRRAAEEEMTGSVGQKRVPARFLEETEIPLPPLGEQQRIVARLEALLSRVNAARERLTKVPAILKRFRLSVLAAACSGRLTADWRDRRSDVEPAQTLLDRLAEERRRLWQARNGNRKYRPPAEIEQDVLTEIPQTWVWTNFDHCAWEITVGHVGPMKDRYVQTGIPFLRSQNVRPLRFDSSGLVFIKAHFHASLQKSALHGEEILVTRSGANTGDCCVFPNPVGEANCADLVITRPLSGLLPAYGAIYISSPDGQTRIGLRETGMAQPHFNIGAMRVKPFPLPPLAEQHEIVQRVGVLFNLADAIEKRVTAATARADKLTQAILAKAFRGELAPTEAELARQEGRDYEPASVLLERIRAERGAVPARPKLAGHRRKS
jgi:type I restriction enzyme S subunit